MKISDFDLELFLSQYWQKQPLIIRNPWDEWINPLEPDELAGLACEAEVESRLVVGDGHNRVMESGPFPEERFGKLKSGPWTLLVQAVDHYVPSVADLLAPFRFVPNWRVDDVMVSYATNGGGVGSHYDNYDVFLVQGLGKRRWRVGPRCDGNTPLLPHKDLRLINDFEALDEWVLGPGDILYVPPCYAHEGVAIGDDCMTYSIGFRAPALGELVEGWAVHIAEQLPAEARYTDAGLQLQAERGEITSAAIEQMHSLVLQALSDRTAFSRWFGQHNSVPKYDKDWRPETLIDEKELLKLLAQGSALTCNPASRFSFIQQSCDTIALFVDGQTFDCTGDLASLAVQLCATDVIVFDHTIPKTPEVISLICELINQGSLAFDLDD